MRNCITSPTFVEAHGNLRLTDFRLIAGDYMRRFVLFVCTVFMIYANACLAQAGKVIHDHGAADPSLSAEAQSQGENWAELNAEKGGLGKSTIKVMVLGKSDFPEYSNELVRVQWRANDPIDLYVLIPHGVVKPPAILYLYSYPSDTDHFTQKVWGESVTKGGFAAVGFVAALTGQRYHTRPMREWFISELQESLGISTHDVQMILNYLATRGDIDVRKVGMLGQGSGGAIAILAAAADSRITFVDAINPWGDWPDWLKESCIVPEAERAAYLKSEFLQKVAMLDPVKYLPQFTPNRIRIEQTVGDPMTPKDVQAKIAASVSSPESVVKYPDVRTQIHVWMTQNWWLKEQLQPSPTTPATVQFNHGNRALEH
jgi:hypothetical protein